MKYKNPWPPEWPQDEKFYDIEMKDGSIHEKVEYWATGGGFCPCPNGMSRLVVYRLVDVVSFSESNASLSIPGDCSVSLAEHQEKFGKLYDADPDCWHELDKNCMSGIRCAKCRGWYCL